MTPEEKLEWCRTIKSLYAGRIVAQAAEIKRLEDALVEERTKDTLLRFASSSHWSSEEKAEETRRKAWEMAREQLRAEGVIR